MENKELTRFRILLIVVPIMYSIAFALINKYIIGLPWWFSLISTGLFMMIGAYFIGKSYKLEGGKEDETRKKEKLVRG